MCIIHVSATHVIHLYFYTCNTPKNNTHLLFICVAQLAMYIGGRVFVIVKTILGFILCRKKKLFDKNTSIPNISTGLTEGPLPPHYQLV